jgi:cytochrome c oxidase assembly protein subunit 11
VYDVFKEKAQWGEFYRVYGMILLALGGYFLTVPFYNVLCQTFGFTMSHTAVDYRNKEEEVNVFRKYNIQFMSHAEDNIPWEFQPQTTQLTVNAGETALAFYKVYNRSDKPIAGIAIYQIFPEDSALYFNKIQCFCFENQLIYPNEMVDLPVLFYLDPAINHDLSIKDVKDIILTYHFYPSAD